MGKSPSPKLVEGIDYYMEDDKMVLTALFLLKRGYCCNKGCRHCPYGEEPMPTVNISIVGMNADGESG